MNRPLRPVLPRLLLLLFLLPLAFPTPRAQDAPVAQPTETARQGSAEDEQAAIATAREELNARRAEIQRLRSGQDHRTVDATAVEEARLALESARVEVESTRLDRVAADRRRSDLEAGARRQEDQIKSLRAGQDAAADPAAAKQALSDAEAALATLQSQLATAGKQGEVVSQRYDLARQRQSVADEWYNLLQELFLAQQEQSRRGALEDLEARLHGEQNTLLTKAAGLRDKIRQLPADSAEGQRQLLEAQAKEAEEQAFLLQFRLKHERLRSLLDNLNQTLPEDYNVSSEVLESARADLSARRGDLATAVELGERKHALLQQQLAVIDKRQNLAPEAQQLSQKERRIISDLASRFRRELDAQKPLLEEAQSRYEALDAAYVESVRRGLTVRHSLPRDMAVWRTLLQELAALPVTLFQAGSDGAVKFVAALQQADVTRWVLLLLAEALWLGLNVPLWRLKRHREEEIAHVENFTLRATLVALAVLRNGRRVFLIGGILLIAVWISGAAAPAPALFGMLAGLWLGARVVIDLSRWMLVSALVPAERREPGLHRLISAVAVVAALLAVVVAAGHLGLYTPTLRDLLDRLFLIILLPLIFFTLQLRAFLMETLRERMTKRHWVQIIGLLSFSVPLSVLGAAGVGLVGYINLAWSVASHLGWLLLVLFAWLLVRGVLRDLVNKLKSLVVERSSNGLLWAQGVIDPLHRVTRVVLALVALGTLFRLYGWTAGSPVLTALREGLKAPLFSIGEVSVDLQQVLGTALLVVVVIWLARWVRQFTYRWLYARISDLGVRNSLSVFTQYALVLVGLLVALNTLGIDLTSLAIFAGALGVGIGFGLQNIANNFISGIILLLERPIRTSDWVTIASNQGEVTRIGIRSVTVTTWDNQEVIIPNADIISSPFVNWTRSDNFVRTVFQVGVSYHNDPKVAQRVLMEAVTAHPAVVRQPEPRVFLIDFGASSVDFRVHYFVDVRRNSPFQVKSEVMLAIWDALKAAGIEIPFPQQDLYIKEWPAQPSVPIPG